MSELGIRIRDVGRSRAEVRVGTDGRTQGRAAEAAGHDVADGLVSAELTIIAVNGPFRSEMLDGRGLKCASVPMAAPREEPLRLRGMTWQTDSCRQNSR